jgi:hypothetical protein
VGDYTTNLFYYIFILLFYLKMMKQGIAYFSNVGYFYLSFVFSNKPVVEVLGNSLRSSQSEHCFKASISLMRSEGLNIQLLLCTMQY